MTALVIAAAISTVFAAISVTLWVRQQIRLLRVDRARREVMAFLEDPDTRFLYDAEARLVMHLVQQLQWEEAVMVIRGLRGES